MLDLLKRLVSLAATRNFLLALELITIPLEIIAIILAIYAIVQSNIAIRLQTESNNDQRIATAWSQLANPAPGNSGKGEAINLLFEKGEELSGMLLDCETMGGTYVEDPKRRCKGAPYISGLRLIGGGFSTETSDAAERLEDITMDSEDCTPDKLRMVGSDFSGSVFKDSILYCGMLIDVTARNVFFDEAVIANSWLYNFDISDSDGLILIRNRIDGMIAINTIFAGVDFKGTHASGVNFTNAKFENAKFAGLEGEDFNVSGADFCYFSNEAFPPSEENCPDSLPDEVLAAMWVWSDMPPKGIGSINEKLRSIRVCPSELRMPNFGSEFNYYGFVYDRGYKAPGQCPQARRN